MMNKPINVKKQKRNEQARETTLAVTEKTELMKFLLEKLAGKGRNHIKGILARGQVSVAGKKTTQYNHPLEVGQQVVISWAQVGNEEKLVGLKILHEDQDLIVINKEAGLLSIASEKEKKETAYHFLMEHVRLVNPKNRIFVVHRLDRDTSGVMMYSKSKEVQQLLQNSWKESVQDRRYIALVEGAVQKPEGTITSWLTESKTLKMYSNPTPNGGQKAITHYKVLEKNQNYSLLEVRLETGKKNQIRVHMQTLGHSIVGDKKYGSTQNPIGRMGLHALEIKFTHPTTGAIMHFKTDIPGKFLRMVK
ncbi:RluA family pseudouridine synthase [Neobacillus sp. PS3-40]|uniref:RluA family pseudouridine synthase n=1 Tax=Neobacillus sp. PS3-40 TaxID=3070679 RepID=UPI0035A9627F